MQQEKPVAGNNVNEALMDAPPLDQVFGDYSLGSFQQETSAIKQIEVASPVTPELLRSSARRRYQMSVGLGVTGVVVLLAALLMAYGTAPGPMVAKTVTVTQEVQGAAGGTDQFSADLLQMVSTITKGPVGYVMMLAGILMGAMAMFRGQIMTAIPMMLTAVMISKLDTIVTSLGITSAVTTREVQKTQMVPSSVTTWDFGSGKGVAVALATLVMSIAGALLVTALQRKKQAEKLAIELASLQEDE